MNAVGRELFRFDVSTDVPGRSSLGEQVLQELIELMLRSGDVLALMHECRQFSSIASTSGKYL